MRNRRLAIYVLAAVFSLVLVWWAASYLTEGKITITTSSGLPIVLTRPGDSKFKEQANGKLSLRLKSGKYVATVSGNSLASSQLVEVKSRKTTSYVINPAKTSGVEPVMDAEAYDLAVSDSRLFYINANNQFLSGLDGNNNFSPLNSSIRFKDIKWASSGFGVGDDSAGNFYTITNGQLKQLDSAALNRSAVSGIALSPDRKLYVLSGNKVYESLAGGPLKQFYTAKSIYTSIVAANDAVLLINNPDFSSRGEGESSAPTITLIDSNKKVVSKKIGTFVAGWSGDGKYLAVSSSSTSEILDTKLNLVASIPAAAINSPLWLDSSTLLYSLNDQLWSYNLPTGKSSLLANMPLGGAISEIALSDKRDYVYVIAHSSNSSQSLEIKRIGLSGQSVAPYIYQLQNILPKDSDSYSLSLVNFSSPVVYVRSNGDSPSFLYLKTAQNELAADGFDLSKIDFRSAP